jgi:hypothetical protein
MVSPNSIDDRRAVPRHLRDLEHDVSDDVARTVAEADALLVRSARIKGWFFAVFAVIAAGFSVYFATLDVPITDARLQERVQVSILTAAVVAGLLAVVTGVVAALSFRRAR